jgi:hypothetical protein
MPSTNLNADFAAHLVSWGQRAHHRSIDYRATSLDMRRIEILARGEVTCPKKAALFAVASNEYVRLFGGIDPVGCAAYSSIVSNAIYKICYGYAPDFNVLETLTQETIDYDLKMRTDRGNQLLLKYSEKLEAFVAFMSARYTLDQLKESKLQKTN